MRGMGVKSCDRLRRGRSLVTALVMEIPDCWIDGRRIVLTLDVQYTLKSSVLH